MKKTNFTVMFPVWAMLALSAPSAPTKPHEQPDNSAQTADEQKNKKDDVALTAGIRKSLMADKTLSMAAHNVKIVAQDGMVTLRGAVKSEEERGSVVSKAREIAGATMVTDLLTVSSTPQK